MAAAPVAAADTYGAVANATLEVSGPGVLANDTDADLDPLTANLVQSPLHGTLSLAPNGSFSYKPNTNYLGPDSFSYRASDGALFSNTVTVSLSVVDGTPIARADSYNVDEDGLLKVTVAQGVLANDTDVAGDALTAVLVNPTTHGTLALAADGSFVYEPADNFAGTDTFTYRASDGVNLSAPQTVALTVNLVPDDPVAVDDSYNAFEAQALVVPALQGVLANDTDADGDILKAVLGAGPTKGTIVLNGNGSFTYTPGNAFIGEDSFTYRANDGQADSNLATVRIKVTPVLVAANDIYTVNEDTALNVAAGAGVLSNDSLPTTPDPLSTSLVAGPTNGTLSLRRDGSFLYTPRPNFYGSDTFTYVARLGGIEDLITGQGNAYSTALDTAGGKIYWTDATTRTVRRADLNGANVENLVSTGLSVPAGIALDLTNNKIYWTDLGTNKIQRSNLNGTTVEDIVSTGLIDPRDLVVDAAGGKIYWVDMGSAKIQRANLDGTTVQDVLTTGLSAPTGIALDAAAGKLYVADNSAGRILRVDTAGTNLEALVSSLNAPQEVALDVAGGRVYWTEAGKIKRSDLSGGNPEDLIASSLVTPSGLAIDAAGGRMYWTDLDTDKIQRSSLGVLQDAFDSNVATVTINVTGVNDVPVAFDDAYPLLGSSLNVPAVQGVLANDFDADGTPITASIVSGATRGIVVLNTNGAFVYTPNSTYQGQDSFTYRVFDGVGNSNIATVFITNRPIVRTENVTITAQSDTSTEGFFDVYVDLAGAAVQVTGYEVQMRLVEQNSGITFVGAQTTAPLRPALLPGQNPTVVGLGQSLQVTDFAASGTVALANGRGLFRAHFVAEAGVVGTFHVTFDTGFTNISNNVAQAIPLGGLVTGTITLVPAANPAPQVAQVMIGDGSATGWTPEFLNHLQATGRGDGGYAFPTGSAAQLDAVPWDTLSTVKVRFTRNVLVDSSDLVLNGVNVARYEIANFSYDPVTFVATWQLAGPITADKLLLSLNANGTDPIRTPGGQALDGEWENGLTVGASGNGVAGGDFRFRFNVLPGDIDRNGRTNIFDTILVRDRQFTAIGDLNYSIFADLTGNGSVNIFDTVRTSNSQFKTLPVGEPVYNPPVTPAPAALATAPAAALAQIIGLPVTAAASVSVSESTGGPTAFVLAAAADAALPAIASDSAALGVAISSLTSKDEADASDAAFGDDIDWSLGL